MQPGYKEKIIMHFLWPDRRCASNITIVRYILFYACMFELAEMNILRVKNNRIWCKHSETGDPVLDEVLSLLLPLSGKKLSRLQLLVPRKAAGIYKKQMALMTEHNFLEREDITFLLWKTGNRYRVRNYDILKPGITKLERILVYGRKWDRSAMLLTLLAGEGNLFRNIFRTKEFRDKAKSRYRELLDSNNLREDETIFQLRKTLRKSLNTQKAVNTVSKT
ncbi:MAG: GPP34 family phosphoprotein [Bacteroidales bacterium]